MPLGPTVEDIHAGTGTGGAGATGSHMNHRHRVIVDAPVSVVVGQANAIGSGNAIARARHRHYLDPQAVLDALTADGVDLAGDVSGPDDDNRVDMLQRVPLRVGTPVAKQVATFDGTRIRFSPLADNADHPWINVLSRGVVRGTLANNTLRAANTTAWNAAILACITENKWLAVPGGHYEIFGSLVINVGNLMWRGLRISEIVQHDLSKPVIHCGAPRGTANTVTKRITLRGFSLRYNGSATSDSRGALELTGVQDSTFREFEIGDPRQNASGATSIPYCGIYEDETANTAPCQGNSYRDGRIKHWSFRGFNAPRPSADVESNGSVFENIYLSLGDDTSKRDLSGVAGACYFYAASHAQSQLINCNFEWGTVPTVAVLDRSFGFAVCDGVNMEGVTLKRATPGPACFFEARGSSCRAGTVIEYNCAIDESVTYAALYGMSQGGSWEVSNVRLEQTGNAGDDGTGAGVGDEVVTPEGVFSPYGLGSHQNERTHYAKWKEAGVQWLRLDFSWSEIEPTQGTYNWGPWDLAVAEAGVQGLQIVACFGYTPGWANGNKGENHVHFEAYETQYKAFVSALVTRYAATVDAWEVWNEPDHDNFFKNDDDAPTWANHYYTSESAVMRKRRAYRQVVDLALTQGGFASKLKTTSGFARGGSYDAGFIPWLALDAAWLRQFAVISHHCYGWNSAQNAASYQRLIDESAAMQAIGVTIGKTPWPAWITEHGITDGTGGGAVKDKAYVIKSFAIALGEGAQKVFWFRGGYDPDHRDMLDASGNRTDVFYAYKTLTSKWPSPVAFARFVNGNTRGYIATMVGGARVAIVWCDTGTPAINTLGLSITTAWNQDGTAIATSAGLTTSPAFLALSN